MSDNKFISQLKGKQTPKSVLEIKNDKLVASFTGVPYSTDVVGAIIDDKDSSVVVAKGAQNWKLDGSSLVTASSLTGDGADYTGEFNASGSGLWINATYSLPDMIFSAGTKWVLKLCGKNLLTTLGGTIGFTLVVKVGTTHITSKTFTVAEGANVFCRQLVIDFSESEQTVIKAQNGDSLTLQLLCADANASATVYNGMTVLTALQRKVDSENVSSDTATFDDLETRIGDVESAISGLGDDFVKTDGSSVMTAPLKFMAGSMRGAVGPYLNGVGFWKLDSQANLTLIATLSDSHFVPTTSNATDLGSSNKTWKDLYLGGKAYIITINNGANISVPKYGGTMVVADFTGSEEQMFLRLDKDLHPVWETVTLTTSLADLTDVTISSASANQVLTYDGSKWVNQAAPTELPTQTGNSGKFLTTDGFMVSWATVPTPTVNYSINGGNYTAGTGSYAITRFSLMLQKDDGTWEKPTDTSVTYSQATDKTVNTNGFLLNQILYYNNTGGVSGGQLTGLNKVYSKHATVPMSYSTNCGTTPGWALGTWIYLVGTLGADGLFYLDTTQWWSDALPNSADGKLYIRLGPVSSSTGDTVALLEDRPIFYHDGNGVKEYHPGGNGGGSSNVIQSIDADIVGAPTINGSDVSNLSYQNYLALPGQFDMTNATSFEISMAFTTLASVNTQQYIFSEKYQGGPDLLIKVETSKISLYLYNKTTQTAQTLTGTTTLSGSTKYYVKVEYDGTDYVLSLSADGVTYTQEATATATIVPGYSKYGYIIGSSSSASSAVEKVHLDGCYIKKNGITVWSGMDTPGLHQRVAKGHEVIEFQAPTSANNYTWYRKYADGWVEQGGHVSSVAYGGTSIVFPVAFADNNYQLTNKVIYDSTNAGMGSAGDKTTTGAKLKVYGYNLNTGSVSSGISLDCDWEATGMAA